MTQATDEELEELAMEIAMSPIINEFCRANPRYGVLVYNYLFGQKRIQLTDREQPDSDAPEGHGSIIRLLDTYNPGTLKRVVEAILEADDPPTYCMSFARPWNTDFIGDRIRLDNKPGDRPERVEAFSPMDAPIDKLLYVRCEGDDETDLPRTAVKRLEADPESDGYVYFFWPIDFPGGEGDEPLFNEETGKSSVVECYVVREGAS